MIQVKNMSREYTRFTNYTKCNLMIYRTILNVLEKRIDKFLCS